MNLGFDFLRTEYLFYHAILINEVCCAQGADGATAACHLFAPASQLLQQSCFGVGYQWEVKLIGIGKFLLQRFFVLAHSDDAIASRLKLSLMLLQRACLSSASAGVCLWITVKYYLATLIVACLNLITVLVFAQYLRYSVSDVDDYVGFILFLSFFG